ncbi:MAG: FimV/HubP family polar landmark protein, partial [Plesiomonas sp.]
RTQTVLATDPKIAAQAPVAAPVASAPASTRDAKDAKKVAAVAATAGVAAAGVTAAVHATTVPSSSTPADVQSNAQPELITPLPAPTPAAAASPSVSAAPVGNVAERYAALENVPVPPERASAAAGSTSAASTAPLAQQAQPIVPLAVSAGMLANTEQQEAQAQNLTPEEAKQLRQQLVDSAAEISRLTENNVSLTNQVSELQIRVKQLQIELDNEVAFRKEANQAMAQAAEQAKALELERMKNKMLEESSGSLIQQMSRSWPLAIGVGVIPPVLLGALLWLLYRVRQRRQNALLSQAFEEHQPKDFGGAAAFALGNDTPDLSRPDDMEMPWEEADTSAHPAENSTQPAAELPQPPSLFASLPGLSDDNQSENDNDGDVLLNTPRRETGRAPMNEEDFDLAYSHADNNGLNTPESAELASLVDLDLAHDEMLGGDEIVDVLLSTPSLAHGSPLDHDDEIRLLADMDDEDPILSLSDEDLFESLTPAATKVATPETAAMPEPEQTKKSEPEIEPAVAAPAQLESITATSSTRAPVTTAPVPAVEPVAADADDDETEADAAPQQASIASELASTKPAPVVQAVALEPEPEPTDVPAPVEPSKATAQPSVTEMATQVVAADTEPAAAADLASEPLELALEPQTAPALQAQAVEQPEPIELSESAEPSTAVAPSDEPLRQPVPAVTEMPALLDLDLATPSEWQLAPATETPTAEPSASSAELTLPAPDVADVAAEALSASEAESAPEVESDAEPFRSETERTLAAALAGARHRSPLPPLTGSDAERGDDDDVEAQIQLEPTQPEPAQSEPAQPEPTQSAHAQSELAPEPVNANDQERPEEPHPTDTEAAHRDAYRAHESLLTPEEQKQLFAEQLLDLPEMTEADFDLSAPMSEPAAEWRMPVPPEPASEDEDWAAQDNLMAAAVQVTPEERDAFTQSFVEAEAQETEADDDVVGKLILARAYLDIDDPEGAQPLLESVLKQGNSEQQEQARKMLQEMA